MGFPLIEKKKREGNFCVVKLKPFFSGFFSDILDNLEVSERCGNLVLLISSFKDCFKVINIFKMKKKNIMKILLNKRQNHFFLKKFK